MDAHNPVPPANPGAAPAMAGATPAGAGVLRQVAHLLKPLVRLLLAHGVTYPRLCETLKGVFIEEARRGAGQRAGRLTDSYLAVTTGIHRKDVRRLAADQAQARGGAADAHHGLASAVFTRWLSDPAYCDAAGQPRPLARGGERGFEEMVKAVSTDVHPRTVLNELMRLELVSVEADLVHLKVNAFVPNPDTAQMLQYLSDNLHDHAAAAVRNVLGGAPACLEQSIYSDAIPAAAVAPLEALARDQWLHFLKKMVPAVARQEVGASEPGPEEDANRPPRVRMRLGMYFYAEEEGRPRR